MTKNRSSATRNHPPYAYDDLLSLAGKRVVCGLAAMALATALTPLPPSRCLAQGSSKGERPVAVPENKPSSKTQQKTLGSSSQTPQAEAPLDGGSAKDGDGDAQNGEGEGEGSDAQGTNPVDNTPPAIDVTVGSHEVADGAVLSEGGRLEVTVRDSSLAIEEGKLTGVDVRLMDSLGVAVPFEGEWVQREGDASAYSLATTDDLPDGRYGISVHATDEAAHEATLALDFCVDTQAPDIRIEAAWEKATGSRDDVCYFNRPQTINVHISDLTLDLEKTTVNGTSLKALMARDEAGEALPEDEGITYGDWETTNDGRGETCACSIFYDEGSYDLPIVRAWDVAGHQALGPEGENNAPSGFVVDATPPNVIGFLSNSPARVLDDEPGKGPIAFFGEDTSLELLFLDNSGIRSVALLEEPQESYGHVLKNMQPDNTRAQIDLGSGPFDDAIEIAVYDIAGNESLWSMRPKGRTVVADTLCEVDNKPLRQRGTGELVSYAGHPHLLVEDDLAPVLELRGVREGAYSHDAQTLMLEARDQNLGYVASYDQSQYVMQTTRDGEPVDDLALRVAYEGADVGDKSHTYTLHVPADRLTHENDGDYVVTASMRDMAGNEATTSTSFVIDTIPPVLTVAYEDGGTGNGYLRGERKATISVVDRNLTTQKLNTGGLIAIDCEASAGRKATDIVVGPWQRVGQTDEYACSVTFPPDGTYSFAVHGTDEAGNVLVGGGNTHVSDEGTYESGIFVTDATAPNVSFSYAPGMPNPRRQGEVDYFRKPVHLEVHVRDRNLDSSRTTVTDSQGNVLCPMWVRKGVDADGTVTYDATIVYREEETGNGSGRKAPHVYAVDLASNETRAQSEGFVVDQTPPYVRSANLNKAPSAEGRDASCADPTLFLNALDGVPATMSVAFEDEFGVDAVWVDDPDGVYDARVSQPVVQKDASITLAFKDVVAQGDGRNTDIERNVCVYARDVAGNVRVWSIDHEGNVVADREVDLENVALLGGLHPLALVYDTSAPYIEISGVEAGAYYNQPQTARIAIKEHNYEYLTHFDPNRVVATVYEQNGNGEPVAHPIVACQFEGSRPRYAYDRRFGTDGHYSVVCAFDDYAGNPSSTASVGTFTIDQTAPTLTVNWDNQDVRNGKYYRAPRTATITVKEHNFDPHLLSIYTTGSVGEWASDGDDHTCVVRFDADASEKNPHKLRISGRDKAGNELTPFEEPDFVVDTHAPTLSIKKRVSAGNRYELDGEATALEDESAFAQGMAPIVEFVDDANFDALGVEVTLVGRRAGTSMGLELVPSITPMGEEGERVEWGNLGLEGTGEDTRYLMSADDIYTITARVTDKAGNSSREESVSFSVNRYGSNYFFEEVEGLKVGQDDGWDDIPLICAPRIVVHEVNVSGSDPSEHLVTKEHACTTSQITRTDAGMRDGYTLESHTEKSEYNPYEGWTEYVYTIQAGNFGEGSDSDHGDGGQGLYRIDVSSRDRADNNNTTSSYWDSDAARADSGSVGGDEPPLGKTATASFTLDELGPTIRDVNLPQGLVVGDSYEATFSVEDEITQGDMVSVLVDGEPVEVFREGSGASLAEGEVVRPGSFIFKIPAKTTFAPREVEICVFDYTGLETRSQVVKKDGFLVTTLWVEAASLVFAGGICAYVVFVVRHRLCVGEPSIPTRM